MSAEVISLGALVVMFVVATALPINIGVLAFLGAFAVGTSAVGLSEDEIFAGFPVSLFITIVGVTYLFAVAHRNGTVDVLVRAGVRLVRGRVALVPWVVFAVAAVLTAFGTFAPAAVALLVPIGMSFAHRHRMSPLMIGMMTICGAHAGSFSPIAVSGVLVSGMLADNGLPVAPHALFLASLAFNFALAAVTFALLRKSRPAAAGDAADQSTSDELRVGWRQWLTLACLLVLAVGALVFRWEVGVLALAAATLLTAVDLRNQAKAVEGISWSTILLVAGMVTYVGVLEKAGTIELISRQAAESGAPLLVALLLCIVVAVASAFASSTAILTAIIPMAVPLLLSSHLSTAGLVAALAISTTIVDVSPFSTNGALVLSNAQGVDRTRFYKQIIGYSGAVVALGPVFAWGALVLPGAV